MQPSEAWAMDIAEACMVLDIEIVKKQDFSYTINHRRLANGADYEFLFGG